MIGDRVLEGDVTLLAGAWRVGKAAVVVVDKAAGPSERTADDGDACGQVDAVSAGRVVGEHVDMDRGIFGRLRRAVGDGRRHVVDDVDNEVGRRRITIAVGDDDPEILLVGVTVARDQQRVAVGITGRRRSGDRQVAIGAMHHAAIGDVDAANEQRSDRVVTGSDRQRTRRGLAGRYRVRTVRIQRGLVDGRVRPLGDDDRWNRIRLEMDCRGRGRHVAVAIGDRVAEGHITLFTRTRRIGEAAVVVVNQAAGTCQRSVDHCDLGREVDAVRAKRVIRGDGNRHRRIFGCLRDAVVYRRRHVVDDVDDKVAGGNVAVMVGHGDREGLRRIIARGVVEQRVAIPDRASRYAGDGQHASRIGDGLADRRDRRAVDRDHRGRIALSKGDRARRCLAIRGSIGAGGFTGAHRQAALVNGRPSAFAVGVDQDRRRLIGDADRQGRARRIAVTVGERVVEHVAHPATRARIADIAVAAVGRHRQRAILAVDDEIAGSVEA